MPLEVLSARGRVSWERSKTAPFLGLLDPDLLACSCSVLMRGNVWRPSAQLLCWPAFLLGSELLEGGDFLNSPSALHPSVWQRVQHTVGLQHVLVEMTDRQWMAEMQTSCVPVGSRSHLQGLRNPFSDGWVGCFHDVCSIWEALAASPPALAICSSCFPSPSRETGLVKVFSEPLGRLGCWVSPGPFLSVDRAVCLGSPAESDRKCPWEGAGDPPPRLKLGQHVMEST